MVDIRIAENSPSLARIAADAFIDIANNAIRDKDHFFVALSGGSTPKVLYSLLASAPYNDKIDWTKVHFFFGDERNVPDDDERSNYRMARKALFEPLKIDESKVTPWITAWESPPDVAEMYELAIRMAFDPELDPANDNVRTDAFTIGNRIPEFDLILLGLGPDGHTASLFPHTTALDEAEKLAVANFVPHMNEFRFTMTLPLINSAAKIAFLVSGAEKASIVKDVIEGPSDADDLPAQRVRSVGSDVIWLVDQASASLLTGS